MGEAAPKTHRLEFHLTEQPLNPSHRKLVGGV